MNIRRLNIVYVAHLLPGRAKTRGSLADPRQRGTSRQENAAVHRSLKHFTTLLEIFHQVLLEKPESSGPGQSGLDQHQVLVDLAKAER